MLDIFFSSLFTVIFFTGLGSIFERNKKNNLFFYTKSTILGCILLSFLGLIVNFFFPLNQDLNSIFIFISLIFIILNKKFFLNLTFLKYLIISSIIISLLLFGSHTYRPDAGLYHIPYISTLNNEKIIIGLSNLHYRFGHISIIQYTSAANFNHIIGINGIVFPSALIAVSVSLNFFYHLKNYIKKKNFNFHFFFILGLFIYICFKLNRYSEYGNDAPAHFLVFYLISEFIFHNFKLKINEFLNLFMISVFVVLNKVFMLFILIIPLIYLRNFEISKIFKNAKFWFAIFLGLIWLIKNIIISGCVIYPVSFTCINKLNWTDSEKAKEVSLENEAFTKGWPAYKDRNIHNQNYFIKNFNWIKTWSKKQIRQKEILLPYVIFLLFFTYYIYLNSKKNPKFKLGNENKLLLITLFLSMGIWFIKIPTYRYGFSIIISWLSIIFGYFCAKRTFKNINQNKLSKIIFGIIIIFSSIVFFKNGFRIIKTQDYENYPFPRFYSHSDDNIKSEDFIIKNINNINLYISENGYCMYKSLCTPYKIKIDIEKNNNYLKFRKN